jgi:hypothetical protein
LSQAAVTPPRYAGSERARNDTTSRGRRLSLRQARLLERFRVEEQRDFRALPLGCAALAIAAGTFVVYFVFGAEFFAAFGDYLGQQLLQAVDGLLILVANFLERLADVIVLLRIFEVLVVSFEGLRLFVQNGD